MRTWYQENQDLKTDDSHKGLALPFMEDKTLIDYLTDLSLLKNVPIQNLAADSSWLQKETLLYFYIDPDWVECLLDGALSIGRDTTSDKIHDGAIKGQISEKIYRTSVNRRNQRLDVQETEAEGDTLKSGFILYSDLVRGWPNLEIRCYEEEGGQEVLLSYQRFEKLTSDSLIGIVSGCIRKIVFKDPDEELHMGFDEDIDGNLIKNIKEVSDTEGLTVQVSYRDKDQRVIDILSIKKEMEKVLSGKENILSPAEFGLQMIQESREYTKIIKEV